MGYVKPIPGRFKALREERGWLSVERFATDTGVDVRLARKADKAEMMQAEKLRLIARQLNVPLDRLIDEAREDAIWPSYSLVQIYKDWEPSWRAIESAQESILIIDSFFLNEHGRLRAALEQNAAKRTTPLTISIFITSPEREFGAQRKRELRLPVEEASHAFTAFAKRITQSEMAHYKKVIGDIAGPIQHSGDGLNARVVLFEYVCMPSIRIILVDGTQFFWSWFPLGAQNPSHLCLHLHDKRDINLADRELCDRLHDHISWVKKLSRKTGIAANAPQEKV